MHRPTTVKLVFLCRSRLTHPAFDLRHTVLFTAYRPCDLLLLVVGPPHLPGIGIDASESSLMNNMMGDGLYIDQSSSQRALAPEDAEPFTDTSVHQADAVSLQEHFAQQQLQSLESFHVQQPAMLAQMSTQISLSSDTAQNTCIPVAETERRSGDESVNDYAAKPEETMDDIMRFFLKVWFVACALQCGKLSVNCGTSGVPCRVQMVLVMCTNQRGLLQDG